MVATSGSSDLTTLGENALLTSRRNRVWSGGSRNRKPGVPNGRTCWPAAKAFCAIVDLVRSLQESGWRRISSHSAKVEKTWRSLSGSCIGPLSRIRAYTG